MEETLFQIICSAGEARSLYVEAMRAVMKKDYEMASQKIKDGKRLLSESHDVHFNLVSEEAKGNKVEVRLLMVHAEDIMMSAETLGIIAETMLDGNMGEEESEE